MVRANGVLALARGNSLTFSVPYFLSGVCRDGQRCLFSHDRANGRVDNVCRYYLKGECIYGARCRYDHIRTKPRTDNGAWSGRPSRGTNQGSRSQLSTAEGTTPACSSSVNRTPHTGGVPTRSMKSYASIVRPDGSIEKAPQSKEASLPLCPYEVASNGCPMRATCTYLHGELCDLCQKPCLHPYNEQQRAQHREECVQRHEQDMELSFAIQRSADKCCGICMDVVMEKEPPSERRFGILEKCSHIFCLNCIRKWRGSKQFDSKTVRSCPECRVPSDFVTPSSFWVDMGGGEGQVNSRLQICHEREALPVLPGGRRQNHNGDLEIMERLYLWDFLDVADSHMFAPFNLEDMFEILSETEDSDSDWSDIDILLN
ncbi:hypothetical protein MRX96_023561 [Rhipicephalus microplus]